MNTMDRAIYAIDASRRVGWAKFFAKEDECQQLEALLDVLLDMIVFHERLNSSDPVVLLAQKIRSQGVRD